MTKVIDIFKQKMRIFSFLILIFLIVFVNVGRVNASYMDEESVNNRKERQLIQKIKIIKTIFGQSVDEAALYATVVHRGTLTDYVEQSYDKDFDEDSFKDNWSKMNTDVTNLFNNIGDNIMTLGDTVVSGAECLLSGGTDEDGNKYETDCVLEKVIEKYASRLSSKSGESTNIIESNIKKPQAMDLLTAATIVMLDSSGWTGAYSDDNYKKALAGDGFVGNMFDDDKILENFASTLMNGVFCTTGAAVDSAFSWFNVGANFSENNGFGVQKDVMKGKLSRYYTMSKICSSGFIGGTYESVQNPDLSTDAGKERYQKKKDVIAKQIIDIAERYRSLFSSGGTCATGSTQASAFKDMTTDQYIETMGPIAQSDYSRTGIFASVTLAQSIIESGWGKSGLTQLANNMFGIKCSSNWTGECINMNTQEYGSSGYYTTGAAWRKYDSVESSVSDHSSFFKDNSRYGDAGVLTATTYSDQIKKIHKAGYATDPNYSTTIISTIKTYNLDKWDVKTNSTSSSSICSPVGNNGWTIRTVTPTSSDQAFVDAGSSNRGQCVWYARGRAIEIVRELGTNGKLSLDQVTRIVSLLQQAYGNGGEIYDNAKSVFNSSNDIKKPKAGSYIVWKQPGKWGHVAIVEDVTSTTITLTEGWSTGGGNYSCSADDDWSCVHFEGPTTYNLEDFYSNYGQNRGTDYVFSGYVYFLEPLS